MFGKCLLCFVMMLAIGLFAFAIADDLQPNTLDVPNSIPTYTVETVEEVIVKDNHYLVSHNGQRGAVCNANGVCNMSQAPMKQAPMNQAPMKEYSACSGNAAGACAGNGLFGRGAQRRQERRANRRGGC